MPKPKSKKEAKVVPIKEDYWELLREKYLNCEHCTERCPTDQCLSKTIKRILWGKVSTGVSSSVSESDDTIM
jgi:hypothetical protein